MPAIQLFLALKKKEKEKKNVQAQIVALENFTKDLKNN
jgi:hypothetical protein